MKRLLPRVLEGLVMRRASKSKLLTLQRVFCSANRRCCRVRPRNPAALQAMLRLRACNGRLYVIVGGRRCVLASFARAAEPFEHRSQLLVLLAGASLVMPGCAARVFAVNIMLVYGGTSDVQNLPRCCGRDREAGEGAGAARGRHGR